MSYKKRKFIDLSIEPFTINLLNSYYGGSHTIIDIRGQLYSTYEHTIFNIENSERIDVVSPIFLPNSMRGLSEWFFITVKGDEDKDTLERIRKAYEQIEEIRDPYPAVYGPFKKDSEAGEFEKYIQTIEFPDKCPISVDVSIRERDGEYYCYCTYKRRI